MQVLITGPNHVKQTEIITKLGHEGYTILSESFMKMVSSILEKGKDIDRELQILIDTRIQEEQKLKINTKEIIFLNGGPTDLQSLKEKENLHLPESNYEKIFLYGERGSTYEYGGYDELYPKGLKIPHSRGIVPRYALDTSEQIQFILKNLDT